MSFKDRFKNLYASLNGVFGEGNLVIQEDENKGTVTLSHEALAAHDKQLEGKDQKLQELEDRLNKADSADEAVQAKETAEANLEEANNAIKDLRTKVDAALEEVDLAKTDQNQGNAEAIEAGVTALKDEVARLGDQAGATPTKAKGEEDEGASTKELSEQARKQKTIQETIAKVQGESKN